MQAGAFIVTILVLWRHPTCASSDGGGRRRWAFRPAQALVPSADADLTIVDLEGRWEVRAADLFQHNQHSPYLGATLHGVVDGTLVRGTIHRLPQRHVPRRAWIRATTPLRPSLRRNRLRHSSNGLEVLCLPEA